MYLLVWISQVFSANVCQNQGSARKYSYRSIFVSIYGEGSRLTQGSSGRAEDIPSNHRLKEHSRIWTCNFPIGRMLKLSSFQWFCS